MEKEELDLKKARWKKRMKGQTPIKLTKFQKEILRDCIIRGKMTIKHIDKYYVNLASSSFALRRLLEYGVIEQGEKQGEYFVKKKYEDSDSVWID